MARPAAARVPVPRRLRLPALVLPLAAALALLAVPFRLVVGVTNGAPLDASYRLDEPDFDHPRLQELRHRERLDEVVAPGRTQFEKIVLLRRWAHAQWKPGRTFRYPCWDAVEILDLARRHDNRGFCAQFAVVFLQACQAMGLHARYTNLPEHFLVSVWSDEYDKWVAMDPLTDVHYVSGGVPLSSRAICQAWWTESWWSILKVPGDGRPVPITAREAAAYRWVAVQVNANQLDHPVLIAEHGRVRPLVHEHDWRRYPLIGGRSHFAFFDRQIVWKGPEVREVPLQVATSDDPADFRYAEHQVRLAIRPAAGRDDEIEVDLTQDGNLDFRTFASWADDGTASGGARLAWRLHPGLNTLACRMLTAPGWQGPEARARVFSWPSLLGAAARAASDRVPSLRPR